ncbi:MAG: DUF6569 family protein [Pseudomonadota bacterium]
MTVALPKTLSFALPWPYRSAHFEQTDRAQFARGRARKMTSVTHSLRQSGERRSDQAAVWADIDQKFAAMASSSETSAMADLYQSTSVALEQFVEAHEPRPHQVGAFYFLHGQLAGVDVFDKASTFLRLSTKLIKSYAIDAIENPAIAGGQPNLSDALRFLERIRDGKWEQYESAGIGQDLRLVSARTTSAALSTEGQLIHLSGFVAEHTPTDFRSGRRRRQER